MEIKVTIHKHSKPGILSKICFILFGVFITSIIFALFLQFLEKIGIWLGLVATLILIFCGFYYTKPTTRLRLVTWGILGTVILVTIFYLVGIIMISNLLERF